MSEEGPEEHDQRYVPGQRFLVNVRNKPKRRVSVYVVRIDAGSAGSGLVYGPCRTEIECLDFSPGVGTSAKFSLVRFNTDGEEETIWTWKRNCWVRCASSC